MTGYGRGGNSCRGIRLRAEISSVNRKQLEVAAQLPRELAGFDPMVRELVATHLHRGRISVAVTIQNTTPSEVIVDEALAARVADSMRQMQARLKLPGEVTLDAVLRAPGVIRPAETAINPEAAGEALTAAITAALKDLQKMREREGAHLAKELKNRVGKLRALSKKINARAPGVAKRLGENLRKRLETHKISIPRGDERLLKEIALFAERADITEEIIRVESHLAQFDGLLKSKQPVGRTMEFLSQELFREFNTMGAKAGDAEIARLAVESKSEVEKIREQLANVE